jgi:hypothetical protein
MRLVGSGRQAGLDETRTRRHQSQIRRGSAESESLAFAQYFAGPRVDHVDPPAGKAHDALIGFAPVLGPVVSKPTLDRNTHIRAKKDDCRHFAPIAGLRRAALT